MPAFQLNANIYKKIVIQIFTNTLQFARKAWLEISRNPVEIAIYSKQQTNTHTQYVFCRLQTCGLQLQRHYVTVDLKISLNILLLERQVMYFQDILVAMKIKRKSQTEWHTHAG